MKKQKQTKITIGSYFIPFTNETLTSSYSCHVYKIYSLLLSSIAVDIAWIICLLLKPLATHFS